VVIVSAFGDCETTVGTGNRSSHETGSVSAERIDRYHRPMAVRTQPKLSSADIGYAYDAAQKVVETHRRLSAWLRPGVTLPQVDTFVAKTLEELDCRSCFLRYKPPGSSSRLPPFPSHACLSVNDCVVHGTAGSYGKPMQPGDVLKIDIGVRYRGWIGDAAWTYVFGQPSPLVKKLTDCGKESLARGVQELRPGNTFLAWAKTVQDIVETKHGFHLVRGLGGHGYGRELHDRPFVSNVVPTYPGEWPEAFEPCRAGTLVAVEPMIAVGTGQTLERPKEWPVYSKDGSLTVHYEHDVYITENGPKVLTEGLEQVRDVIV